MRKNYLLVSMLAFGFTVAAWGQENAPPPAKPADSGPTLAATMQFIQEKLSERGRIGWAETRSNQPGFTRRKFVQLTDVMADPAACTLYTSEAVDNAIELPPGRTLKPGGPLTVDDLHIHMAETDTISFKQIEKITVVKMQDIENQAFAEAAHPEVTATLTPPVFYVKLEASNAVFSVHTSTTKGAQAPVENETTSKINGFTFSDKDAANRVANAMTHAMELREGGT